nr:hypothetical protein [Tanacetum cinerariifolium]
MRHLELSLLLLLPRVPEVVRRLEMMNKNFLEIMRQFQIIKVVDTKCETCGGPHSFIECPAVDGYTQETTYATTGTGSLPSKTVPNPREDLKVITTQSGVTLVGPLVSPPPLSKEVYREPKTITDQVLTGSTNNVPPLVVQPSPASNSFSTISSSKMTEVTKDTVQPSTENIQPLVAQTQIPVVAPKPKPTIPYPSIVNKQKLHALLHMPKFALMFKSLLNNKEKLFDLVTTLMNENYSAVILKKLPEELGDPGKFLIPRDFPEFDKCLALADLGASINLMPLSIWKKLSLPELTSTQMILELSNRSTTRPAGIAADVFVKVGKFHFPTDFVVVDYFIDPRVPLRTGRVLIDVYSEELTLRVNDEAITFKVGQTSKYSYNDVESINRVDVIDVACEEYVQERGDFILEEIEACLTSESIPLRINDTDLDVEGDIRLLEELLNNDPSLSPLPPKELNVEEIKTVKSSIDEPPKLELKELPSHLEYAYLEGTDKLPVIILKGLKDDEKKAILKVLKSHKRAIAWKIFNIKGIDPRFCTHKILMEDDFLLTVQSQRRVNLKIHEGGITVVENKNNELIPIRLVTGWRICIDYRKLNGATRKDHFPLPFMDQMLERLAGNEFYCFLDGFSGYIQIPIDPQDQENTTFTCPYRAFAYRRMPKGLCNAPGTFQRCMMAIFYDMIEKTMEVFKDDFSVFEDSFSSCLSHLDTMLQWCEDTNLVLNWEKCHFMVKEGIVFGHKSLKIDLRRFIQDFSKIARPMTHLLKKETPFVFSNDCIDAFETLKKKLTEAPILVVPDWNLPFELMCNASDFSIGTVLGQRKTNHFQLIHYAIKTMTEAQIHYTTTEKEMIAVVYAFEKFRPYLVLSKSIVYTDHLALKYLLSKQDAKPRLLRWVLHLQEFDIIIRDKKGTENLDPPGAIMVPSSPLRKYLMPVSFGLLFTEMPMTWSHDGIDFMGPFPSSRGNKYILVAVDYFSKWVEAKALPTNDARVVKILKSLFAQFRTPRAIISDRGTYFCNEQFAKVMLKYGVTYHLSTAYHPQTSGQVEVSNRGLKCILKRKVGENHASWFEKLKDALWAFRTAYKKPIGCTPYKLVYGKSCHLPIELEHKAY